MSNKAERSAAASQSAVWWALALLLGLRLASLGLYPLMDNTEARYADIAQVMFARGDWITPWFDSNVPFWGKPPLSFWSTAASFAVFGVNEFAARLPHLLAALGVAWLVWRWARQNSQQQALAALALLAGCSLMLISSGAVMTDMTLVLGTTLAMRGFWLGLHGDESQRGRHGWLFFLGLAVGLLAKGPLVLVLAGLPLGLWTLFSGQLGRVWRDLPWVRGSLAVLLLVAPWYVAAELRTPGFLDYFLLGEHWHRFVTPGWSGDRYGGAHAAPWGSIWLYAWVAILPWSVLLPLAWWRWRKTGGAAQEALSAVADDKSLRFYWALWSLAPAVFFTFAGNILWTYVLPALPPLALLGAYYLSRQTDVRRVNRLLAAGLCLSAVLFAGMVGSLNWMQTQDWHTTKQLVAHYDALNSRHNTLFFYPARPHSAAFYSQGRAGQIAQASDLRTPLTTQPVFLAVKNSALATLPADLRSQLQRLERHGDYTLFLAGSAEPRQPAPVSAQ